MLLLIEYTFQYLPVCWPANIRWVCDQLILLRLSFLALPFGLSVVNPKYIISIFAGHFNTYCYFQLLLGFVLLYTWITTNNPSKQITLWTMGINELFSGVLYSSSMNMTKAMVPDYPDRLVQSVINRKVLWFNPYGFFKQGSGVI